MHTTEVYVTYAEPARNRVKSKNIACSFIESGFIPPGRSELSGVRIDLPIDWGGDPFLDPNWRMHWHSLRMIDPMLVAWEEYQDDYFLKKAADIVIDWGRWAGSLSANYKVAWYDMSTGLRAGKIAYLLDKVEKKYLPNEYLHPLAALGVLHAVKLYNKDFFNTGNHGIFQANGLMALAKKLKEYELSGLWRRRALNYLSMIAECQFDIEGGHREGAASYHFFALEKFQALAQSSVWGKRARTLLEDMLIKAKSGAYWLVDPSGKEWPHGDSTPKQRFSREDLVHTHDEEVSFRCFNNGINVVRKIHPDKEKKDEAIFFNTGVSRSTGHNHLDVFNVLWYVAGGLLLTDPGKYAYIKNKARAYVVSRESHNTLSHPRYFKKVSNLPESSTELRDFYQDGNMVNLFAKREEAGVRHSRSIELHFGNKLVVKDTVGGDEPFSINWQFGKGVIIKEKLDKGSYLIGFNGVDFKVSFLCPGGVIDINMQSGVVFPEMRGWVSESYGVLDPAVSVNLICEKGTTVISSFQIAETGEIEDD